MLKEREDDLGTPEVITRIGILIHQPLAAVKLLL
jgi:hypothetical protein